MGNGVFYDEWQCTVVYVGLPWFMQVYSGVWGCTMIYDGVYDLWWCTIMYGGVLWCMVVVVHGAFIWVTTMGNGGGLCWYVKDVLHQWRYPNLKSYFSER